jgi:transcriptional regulator
MRRRAPKVDQRLIREALSLRKQGKTQEEIAVQLGITHPPVSIILRANGAGGRLVRARRSLVLIPET